MHAWRELGSEAAAFGGDLSPHGIEIGTGSGKVITPTGEYPFDGLSIQHKRSGDQWLMYVPGSLYESNGQLTLTVDRLYSTHRRSDVSQVSEGPWTFRFSLGPPTSDTAPLAEP